MNVASSLLSVAGEDCPPQVAQVLARGGLAPVPPGACGAELGLDARTVRKLPVDDAVVALGYLRSEVLAQVFRSDRRKTVRYAVMRHCARLEAHAAAEAYQWGSYEDSALGAELGRALLQRCGFDEVLSLLELDTLGRNRLQLAGRLCELVDGPDDLVRLLGTELHPTVRDIVHAAALSGLLRGVDHRDAVASCDDVVARIARISTLTAEMVDDAMRDDRLAAALVDRCSQYGSKVAAPDTTREALARHLGDPESRSRALELWTATAGDRGDAIEALGPDGVATLDPEAAFGLLRRGADSGPGWSTAPLWRRVLAGAGGDELLLSSIAERCCEVDVLVESLELLDDDLSGALAEALCRRVERQEANMAPMREHLVCSGAPLDARISLLRASDGPDVVDELVDEMVGSITAQDGSFHNLTRQLANLLEGVPLRHDHLVALVSTAPAACGNWWHSTTAANDCTVEVLVEVLGATSDPLTVVRAALQRPGEVPLGLLDAMLAHGRHHEVSRVLAREVPLDDARLERLCSMVEPSVGNELLAGTRANPLTHQLRSTVLSHVEPDPVALVRSFTALAPLDEERHLLRDALDGDTPSSLSVARRALEGIELRDDELMSCLVLLGESVVPWSQGCYPSGYDPEMLSRLVAGGHLQPLNSGWLALAPRLVEVPGGVEALLASHGFLIELRGAARRHMSGFRHDSTHVEATEVAWRLCHEQLGDNVVAWGQLASQLDDWPGSLGDLLQVAKAVAGI